MTISYASYDTKSFSDLKRSLLKGFLFICTLKDTGYAYVSGRRDCLPVLPSLENKLQFLYIADMQI